MVTQQGITEGNNGWAPDKIAEQLARDGFAYLSTPQLTTLANIESKDCAALQELWVNLPADKYMPLESICRFRRYGSFHQYCTMNGLMDRLEAAELRPHWQPEEYNRIYGGKERWFAPLTGLSQLSYWAQLLIGLGTIFRRVDHTNHWFIETHQIRVTSHLGIGDPTPEGLHRDGVDFVAIILVNRQGIRGGITHIYSTKENTTTSIMLVDHCSALILADKKVLHRTSVIFSQQIDQPGWRDVLVLTYRKDGFLDINNSQTLVAG